MMQKDILLVIDTTAPRGSLAVLQGQAILAEVDWYTTDSHAEFILQKIDQSLQQAGQEKARIDGYVVVTGPGSFTGIRIGLGIVMGLAEAYDRPIYPISALQALAYGCSRPCSMIRTIIDAGRNQVYAQSFWREILELTALTEPACLDADSWLDSLSAKDMYFCGNGAEKYQERILLGNRNRVILPLSKNPAVHAGLLAGHLRSQSKIEPVKIPEALYIRPPDIFRTAGNRNLKTEVQR